MYEIYVAQYPQQWINVINKSLTNHAINGNELFTLSISSFTEITLNNTNGIRLRKALSYRNISSENVQRQNSFGCFSVLNGQIISCAIGSFLLVLYVSYRYRSVTYLIYKVQLQLCM